MKNVSKNMQSTNVEKVSAAGGQTAPAGAVVNRSIYRRQTPKYRQIRLDANSQPNTNSKFLTRPMHAQNQV